VSLTFSLHVVVKRKISAINWTPTINIWALASLFTDCTSGLNNFWKSDTVVNWNKLNVNWATKKKSMCMCNPTVLELAAKNNTQPSEQCFCTWGCVRTEFWGTYMK
jgi:hypothetical protein